MTSRLFTVNDTIWGLYLITVFNYTMSETGIPSMSVDTDLLMQYYSIQDKVSIIITVP